MARRWFAYWLHSIDDHSLQAPFIYDFYQNVINTTPTSDHLQPLFQIKKSLLSNRQTINVTDYGAGTNRSLHRKISEIAKASHQPKVSRLLFNYCLHYQPGTIVELGTSLGLSTMHMALARPDSRIITLEGCPETAQLASKNFQSLPTGNIELLVGEISQNLPNVLSAVKTIDLLFMDANHRYQPSLDYFNHLSPAFHSGTVVVLDDINWSGEMRRAWDELKDGPEVRLSIDLFYAGLLFFKENLPKSHYILAW